MSGCPRVEGGQLFHHQAIAGEENSDLLPHLLVEQSSEVCRG